MLRFRGTWAVIVLWMLLFAPFMTLFGTAPEWLQDVCFAVVGSLPLMVLVLAAPKMPDLRHRTMLLGVTLGALALVVTGLAVEALMSGWLLPAPMPSETEPAVAELSPAEPEVDPQDLTLGAYGATPHEVIDAMFQLAGVTEEDVVYDLGCGDGRIVIAAAKKHGARAVGIELDPQRVEDSERNVQSAKVEDLVEIRQGDAFNVVDIDRASVVTLYVHEDAMLRLRPILQKKLKVGSRVVSYRHHMGEWIPDKVRYVWARDRAHHVYLWRIKETHKSNAADISD